MIMRSVNIIRVYREENEEQVRIEELRRLSNVVQALENVVVQCADVEGFRHVREFALDAVHFYRGQIQQQIHQE